MFVVADEQMEKRGVSRPTKLWGILSPRGPIPADNFLAFSQSDRSPIYFRRRPSKINSDWELTLAGGQELSVTFPK